MIGIWVFLLVACWSSSEGVTPFPFFPEKGRERFSFQITNDLANRKFRVLAASLQKEFQVNLMVSESANVAIEGNFSEVTINEFLTYVCETYGLVWHKVGAIYHFEKPPEPPWTLNLSFDEPTGRISLDVRDMPVFQLARRLTEELPRNIIVSPNLTQSVTGFVRDLELEMGLAALLEPNGLALEDRDGYFQIVALSGAPDQRKRDSLGESGREADTLTYSDGRFSGTLAKPTLVEALERLAGYAHHSIRLLDGIEGSGGGIVFDGQDFTAALNKLFAGTPYSYKLVDAVYLVGLKNRPELKTSELVTAQHINAQNALAYLSGEMGLFQTFSLPSSARSGHVGPSSSTLSGGRSSESSRHSANAVGRDGGAGPGRNTGDFKKTLAFADKVSADITLVREYNALLVTGTQDVIEEVKKRLQLIDRPAPQVLIQALVVDFQATDVSRLGVDIINEDNRLYPEMDLGLDVVRAAGGRFQIGKLPANFRVRLQALTEKGKAKIIFKPHIATLSGHEAFIELGNTQSILLESETLVGDETPRSQVTQRIETIEANISLRIIPWVTASGEITTYIEPIFNNFLGQVEGNVPPPLSTRRLQSTVRLKNGQTIILGGLIEESLRKNERGLPGLSRIPWLGRLFRNHDRNFSQSELVIYLTPYVYYGDEGSVEVIRDIRGIDFPLDIREQQKLDRTKRKKRGPGG